MNKWYQIEIDKKGKWKQWFPEKKEYMGYFPHFEDALAAIRFLPTGIKCRIVKCEVIK